MAAASHGGGAGLGGRVAPLAALLRIAALLVTPTRTEFPSTELSDRLHLVHDNFMHAEYTFDLNREDMKRKGRGHIWLSFDDEGGSPMLRLEGAPSRGNITLVVDARAKMMYAVFELQTFRGKQCAKYPFPSVQENRERVEQMHDRRKQVMQWEEAERRLPNNSTLLEVNWTSSYALHFRLKDRELQAVELKERGDKGRVIKTVRIEGKLEKKSEVPKDSQWLFQEPPHDCLPQDLIQDPLAEVQLLPPHQKSSALNDLLLILADHSESKRWPHLFIFLSAITVPGDVAVLIENPAPPNLSGLGRVSFNYTSSVQVRGAQHTSHGSIWLYLKRRILHLQGVANETKLHHLGLLVMDLIAQGKDPAEVYSNVDIPTQGEQQCVAYDYPQLSSDKSSELEETAGQGLSFFAICQLNGEDCGIFTAPLARGRWIHLWVDMNRGKGKPGLLLRTEVHKNGRMLRSTDIIDWQAEEGIGGGAEPKDEWGCVPVKQLSTPGTTDGSAQLAHLGLITHPHKRSLDLQDTLYALRYLSPQFSLLSVLGLTGDVALMVQVPKVPELWRLPSVTFRYSLLLGPVDGEEPASGGYSETQGDFSANLTDGQIHITARDAQLGATNITVAMNRQSLAVQLHLPTGKRQCLRMPLDAGGELGDKDTVLPYTSAGIFEGVEAIGTHECNRFSFIGTGAHQESVEFWFSREENKVCRLEVLPAQDDDVGLGATINVPAWDARFRALGGLDIEGDCKDARTAPVSWLSLADKPPLSALPASLAIAKLAEASGVVGLLPEKAADTLSRIVVTAEFEEDDDDIFQTSPPTPMPSPKPHQNVDFLSPSLEFFSFYFRSGSPEEARQDAGGPLANAAQGELKVDLRRRRLYLRSEAVNVSGGLPQVSSQVIFQGDTGFLHARTTIDSQDWNRCFSLPVSAAFGKGEAKNPFIDRAMDVTEPALEGKVKKYLVHLAEKKHIEFVLDATQVERPLVLMQLDDRVEDNLVKILVEDWSTEPTSSSLFEVAGREWDTCEPLDALSEESNLAEWDLISVFFPLEEEKR